MRKAIVALISLAVIGSSAAVAHADPLLVTSGSLDYDSDFGCCAAILNLVAGPVTIADFVTGDPILGAGANLSAGTSVAFNVHVTRFGTAFSGDQAEGDLQFLSTPIMLPLNPASMSRFEFTTPFTMTGNLNARTLSGTPVFNGAVAGSGSLQVFLRPVDNTAFFLDDATFTFAAPAQPTPEPGALTLIGVGLVGASTRARWRKRLARSNGTEAARRRTV